MYWIEQHKAALITALIAGIITFAMFSIHISQQPPLVAETYIDITPEEQAEQKHVEEFINKTKASDKAFNEDEAFKELMKQFKSIPADDFERTVDALSSQPPLESNYPTNSKNNYSTGNYALNDTERKRYQQVKKRLQKNAIAEHSTTNSTFSYSLTNRNILFYDTPRYLCEKGGKVIVNVIVRANGTVKECYVNGATSTTDPCLLSSALNYAKQVVFNQATKTEQLGSVTYYFKPKLSK